MSGERIVGGGPPTYVLISESALSNTNYSADFATLVHPVIHYRYADDPPICPQGNKSNLLVMDFDPTSSNPPAVSSLTPDLAVDNVTVSDAPGVVSTASTGVVSNSNLFIIRTLALANDKFPSEEPPSLAAALELFSQRNTELRRNFEYSTSAPADRH